jgi:hypothetical protein
VPTVDDWRKKFESFTTADEFNAHIPEIKKLGAASAEDIGPVVAKLAVDIAGKRGIVFDNETKKFNAPRPVSVFD